MGIWKDPVTKKWKYEFQFKNQSYGGGGYSRKQEARGAREEKRKRVKAEIGAVSPNHSGRKILEVVDSYLAFSQRQHAEKTWKYKKYVLEGFCEHVKADFDRTLLSITPAEIADYLQTLKTNPVYNQHRKDLSALFVYAKDVLGIPLPQNPCSPIKKLPQARNLKKKTWTFDQFISILKAADPEKERPFLLTLTYTMARVDEVLRLKIQDINFEKKYLTLYTRKTADGSYRGRDIPVNDHLAKILGEICPGRGAQEHVFINPKTGTRYNRRPKFMAGICKRAGIPPLKISDRRIKKKGKPYIVEAEVHLGFHAIRHWAASYLFDRAKVGKATIQNLLGHTNASTTDIYLHSLETSLKGTTEGLANTLAAHLDKVEKSPATSSGFTVFRPNPKVFSSN